MKVVMIASQRLREDSNLCSQGRQGANSSSNRMTPGSETLEVMFENTSSHGVKVGAIARTEVS